MIDRILTTIIVEEKQSNDRKALSQIQLHLSNKNFQDVIKERSATGLWLRLEQFCMIKCLTSNLYLKQCLYSYCLTKGGSLEYHLSIFKEIITNLETMEVKYDEKNLRLILLCSLPPSFVTFRYTTFYSWDILTVDKVYDVLYSKKIMTPLAISFKA